MRRKLLRLGLALAAGLLASRGVGAAEPSIAPEHRVFLEVTADPPTPFVMERVGVRILVGFDSAWFRSHSVALFSREMDFSAKVTAIWLAGHPDFLAVSPPAEDATPPGGRRTLALNDDVVGARRLADRVVDGRTYTVLAIDRSFLPTRPGTFPVPDASLLFAYADDFDENLLTGRQPADRHEVVVNAPFPTLRVRPLPAEGRPAGFTGAVGHFSIRAEASPTAVEVGESLKLTVTLSGEGNLFQFAPPRLPELPGFHVYGFLENRDTTRRFVYDIAPLGTAVDAVPPVPFHFFDPEAPAGYRTIRTAAIPLAVRPAGAGPVAPAPGPESAMPSRPGPAIARWLVLAGLAILAGLGGAAVLAHRRARRREGPAPESERLLRLEEELAAGLGAPGSDPAEAFAAYLAGLLRSPPAAVISPDLDRRLVAAGVPPELARRTAALLERLVATRYGAGAHADGAPALARSLAAELRLALEP